MHSEITKEDNFDKHNGKTYRNHPLNKLQNHNTFLIISSNDEFATPFSIDKSQRWREMDYHYERKFYARTVVDPPARGLPASAKTRSERETELEISKNGRQKRKEIRQQKAINNVTIRKEGRKPQIREEEVKENEGIVNREERPRPKISEVLESDTEEEEKKETIRVFSDTMDKKVKAKIMYKVHEVDREKKTKRKLNGQDYV